MGPSHCGRFAPMPLTRRDMLRQSAYGFGAVALAGLMQEDGLLQASESGGPVSQLPHYPGKVRNVVFFFLGGGPSQVETFDPKPMLKEWEGGPIPESVAKDIPRIARAPLINVLPSYWKFRNYGESGIPVSDLMPNVGQHVDDLCIIRSMQHTSPVHATGEYMTFTGTPLGDRPSLGAWLNYGLGSENRNLPGFIVFKTDKTLRPPAFGAGFLPAKYQGILVDIDKGIPHLNLPPGVSKAQRRAQLDYVGRLNSDHRERLLGHSELEARIQSYELAFRMQASAPEAFDISRETAATHKLYGVGDETVDKYARVMLQTRRLVERGVRFVLIRDGDWDFHTRIEERHEKRCLQTDGPIAAFLTDMKQRGLMDETLFIWAGEFGRTPTAEGKGPTIGRDHNPSGYSIFLAGGGVKGGQIIGATDPAGYSVIERPVHPNDLHATILHALGLDQWRTYYLRHNRKEIPTVFGGEVIHEVLGIEDGL